MERLFLDRVMNINHVLIVMAEEQPQFMMMTECI